MIRQLQVNLSFASLEYKLLAHIVLYVLKFPVSLSGWLLQLVAVPSSSYVTAV